MRGLADKVVLITGAASGMGAAGVDRFVAEGARVLVVDLALDRAEEVAGRYGGRAIAHRADVSVSAEIEGAVAAAVDHFGGLDVMWNNAGVHSEGTPIHTTPEEAFDRIIDVNLRGVWLGTRHAVRRFLAQGGGGSVINTASISGIRGMGGQGVYAASKAGVCELTRVTAVEYATFGIRCNVILPGAVLTPLQLEHRPGVSLESLEAEMRGAQPLPVVGTPEDIASAAAFLASDDARFLTGVELPVDGGRTIHLPHRRPGRDVFDYLHPDLTNEGAAR